MAGGRIGLHEHFFRLPPQGGRCLRLTGDGVGQMAARSLVAHWLSPEDPACPEGPDTLLVKILAFRDHVYYDFWDLIP